MHQIIRLDPQEDRQDGLLELMNPKFLAPTPSSKLLFLCTNNEYYYYHPK